MRVVKSGDSVFDLESVDSTRVRSPPKEAFEALRNQLNSPEEGPPKGLSDRVQEGVLAPEGSPVEGQSPSTNCQSAGQAEEEPDLQASFLPKSEEEFALKAPVPSTLDSSPSSTVNGVLIQAWQEAKKEIEQEETHRIKSEGPANGIMSPEPPWLTKPHRNDASHDRWCIQ